MGIVASGLERLTGYNSDIGTDVPDNYMNRLNYAFVQHSSFCNGSFTVYWETFVPSFARLLITLVDFSESDVFRWIFRPRGLGRRGGHARAGTLNRVARALNMKEIEGRKVTDGVKNMWRFDNMTQGLLFYWLVIDATTEFAYNWVSLLHESGGCEYGHALADAPKQTLITLGGWSGGHFGTPVSSHPPMSISGTGAQCGGLNCEINANVELKGGDGPGVTTVSMRIVSITTSGVQITESSTAVAPGDTVGLFVNQSPKNCLSSAADLRTQGFAVEITHGSFYVVGEDDWNP